MSRKILSAALLICALCSGQLQAGHGAGKIYLSPVVAHWMAYQAPNLLDDGLMWGTRAGIDLARFLSLEGFAMRGPSEVSPLDSPGAFSMGASYTAYGAGLKLNIPAGSFYPWLSFAAGRASANFDRPVSSINGLPVRVSGKEERTVKLLGAGFEYFFHENIGLRFDVFDHWLNRDFIDADFRGDRETHNWEFGLGLTFISGGKQLDGDRDGVPDKRDTCPATPAGVVVDKNGCPLDGDGDGVPDYQDSCPESEPGVAVDANGCELVEMETVPLDSDGDGVPDERDKCPATPAAVAVSADGCPLDSDGDGVADYVDNCANTGSGVPVDERGCPRYAAEDFQVSVLFDLALANVKQEFYSELNRVAGLVKQYGVRIRISAYADVSGPNEYNLRLSDRRARAVRDFLITSGVPSSAISYTAHGKYPVDPDGKPDRRYQRVARISLNR
ncbi:thrombospondin type 3 repeat-containing protein [Gemmatimonadota bacterium]